MGGHEEFRLAFLPLPSSTSKVCFDLPACLTLVLCRVQRGSHEFLPPFFFRFFWISEIGIEDVTGLGIEHHVQVGCVWLVGALGSE